MAEARVIVLDADGVFLSERPYWDAALIAALASRGIRLYSSTQEEFGELALEVVRVQSAAKERGCNSNWDMAAVLVRALDEGAALAALQRGMLRRAADELLRAARSLPGDRAAQDPLARAGIDRREPWCAALAEACQRELSEVLATSGWCAQGSRTSIAAALTRLRASGAALGICTGRPRDELEGALEALELADHFDARYVVNGDDVRAAQRLGQLPFASKPHPFPVLAALLGAQRALDVLAGREPATFELDALYVGDARSDFEAARAVRALGVRLRYAHVRSLASDDSLPREVRSDSDALGPFDSLAELAEALNEVRA